MTTNGVLYWTVNLLNCGHQTKGGKNDVGPVCILGAALLVWPISNDPVGIAMGSSRRNLFAFGRKWQVSGGGIG